MPWFRRISAPAETPKQISPRIPTDRHCPLAIGFILHTSSHVQTFNECTHVRVSGYTHPWLQKPHAAALFTCVSRNLLTWHNLSTRIVYSLSTTHADVLMLSFTIFDGAIHCPFIETSSIRIQPNSLHLTPSVLGCIFSVDRPALSRQECHAPLFAAVNTGVQTLRRTICYYIMMLNFVPGDRFIIALHFVMVCISNDSMIFVVVLILLSPARCLPNHEPYGNIFSANTWIASKPKRPVSVYHENWKAKQRLPKSNEGFYSLG